MRLYKKEELEADILKVAHHGSKTSSYIEFLKTVKPKIALIRCSVKITNLIILVWVL
ncbi:MAG: hypothetical protein HFJ54_04040 [Clostridia bacterium]|nr:hypothetical protein [Clostridia bacterium]